MIIKKILLGNPISKRIITKAKQYINEVIHHIFCLYTDSLKMRMVDDYIIGNSVFDDYVEKKITDKISGNGVNPVSILSNERISEYLDLKLQLAIQMNEFINADKDHLASEVVKKTDNITIADTLKKLNINLREEQIDIEDFKEWCNKYKAILRNYEHLGDVQIQKVLEHYLSMKFLNIVPTDTVVDVAAAGGEWADIIRDVDNIKSYRQDLEYVDGINGNEIGGDASQMPVPEGFFDVMTLHCAFECFQGDSDIGLIKETGRVLKNNGRLGIVPLYLDNVYFIKTGPKADKRKIKADRDARWIWRDDQWLDEPFSRHYSPEAFDKRIYQNVPDNMTAEIIYFSNVSEIMSAFPGQKIYTHFMFRAVKKTG